MALDEIKRMVKVEKTDKSLKLVSWDPATLRGLRKKQPTTKVIKEPTKEIVVLWKPREANVEGGG